MAIDIIAGYLFQKICRKLDMIHKSMEKIQQARSTLERRYNWFQWVTSHFLISRSRNSRWLVAINCSTDLAMVTWQDVLENEAAYVSRVNNDLIAFD